METTTQQNENFYIKYKNHSVPFGFLQMEKIKQTYSTITFPHNENERTEPINPMLYENLYKNVIYNNKSPKKQHRNKKTKKASKI